MHRLRRTLLSLAALALVVLAAAFVHDRAGYDPEPWIEDLDALERHMGMAYANLEWIEEWRGLDLAALDRRTRSAIEHAGSRRGARNAIAAFAAAFDDPHVRIERRPPEWLEGLLGLGDHGRNGGRNDGQAEGPSFAVDASGEDVCRSFGYSDDGDGFELDVAAFPRWSPLPDDGAFPGGAFSLPDGRRAGILRIAEFGEDRYLSSCAGAWNVEGAARRESCGGECLDAFRRRPSDALAQKVAGRVEALRAARVDVLVVDVTGNGGGSEWVDPVTRIFSDRPLRPMRVTTVRHPRGVAGAAQRLAIVESAMSDPALSDSSRALLAEARGRMEGVLAELRAPCDRTPMWVGRDPGCTQTLTVATYATGAFDHLPDDALTDVPERGGLYSPFDRDVPTGVWSGPLFVLADARSASATEAFVAMLKDNEAATVIGERTYGAGCGYTDGGMPIELPNSGLIVWMPDCARFRIDGTNEIEGIEPDVHLEWSELGGAERATALIASLADGTGFTRPRHSSTYRGSN